MKVHNILFLFFVILIPIIIYLVSFGFFIYNEQFYTKLTDKYSSIPDKAREMNKDMTDYFQTGTVPASFSEFSEKELKHLEDVRSVINLLFVFLLFAMFPFIPLIPHILGRYPYTVYTADMRRLLFYGGIITMILPLLFILLPFDFLFTQMHNTFFAEGTWMFEGNALLINLYSFDFFLDFAKKIFITGFCLGAVITFLAWLSNRKIKRPICLTTTKFK